MVGDGFPGEARPLDPTKLVSFTASGPKGEAKIANKPGDEPAATLKPDTDGVYVLGYRSTNSRVVLDGPKFETYLKDKGLETIVEDRAARKESQREGRELYSRCAKSVVVVGTATSATSQALTKPLGLPLEVIPITDLTDKTAASAGQEIKFRLLREAKPIENLLVEAYAAGDVKPTLKTRTDAKGEVTFKLDKPGMWLISTVSMHRAPAGQDAEWESIWSSLTFDLAKSEAETPAKTAPAKQQN
jgi:hypothetical protein